MEEKRPESRLDKIKVANTAKAIFVLYYNTDKEKRAGSH